MVDHASSIGLVETRGLFRIIVNYIQVVNGKLYTMILNKPRVPTNPIELAWVPSCELDFVSFQAHYFISLSFTLQSFILFHNNYIIF